MRCTIYTPDLYNLKTRKKLKMYIIVRTKISTDESTKRPQTETILNFSEISYIIKSIKLIQFINQQKLYTEIVNS